MKFTRMRSKLGKRRFVVIEDFTWCERKYFEWFRGYMYFTDKKIHQATIPSRDGMRVRYSEKNEIMFKPGDKITDKEGLI